MMNFKNHTWLLGLALSVSSIAMATGCGESSSGAGGGGQNECACPDPEEAVDLSTCDASLVGCECALSLECENGLDGRRSSTYACDEQGWTLVESGFTDCGVGTSSSATGTSSTSSSAGGGGGAGGSGS